MLAELAARPGGATLNEVAVGAGMLLNTKAVGDMLRQLAAEDMVWSEEARPGQRAMRSVVKCPDRTKRWRLKPGADA